MRMLPIKFSYLKKKKLDKIKKAYQFNYTKKFRSSFYSTNICENWPFYKPISRMSS